ncbi:MAG: YqgE/AlgH family protein [Porticoccaceae bacterium]
MPGLWDPNFSGTISLICEHNEEGAVGFIINQPLDIGLRDVLEQTGIKIDNAVRDQPVLSGGPVAVERGFVMHRPGEQKWGSSMSISDSIDITTSDDIIQAMAENRGPRDAILILGYAGWAPGQLEQEILENSWLTLPATPDVVFDTEFDQRLKSPLPVPVLILKGCLQVPGTPDKSPQILREACATAGI